MDERCIKDDYFDWLYNIVCKNRFARGISYRRLLRYLFDTEFTYSIPKDSNRAKDGVRLRYRFEDDWDSYFPQDERMEPCSILEMMIALAIRCEETIMDNPSVGDRTKQWFWGMIKSLGIGDMDDDHFDILLVENVIDRFLERNYEPNGKGGLFTLNHCDRDLRDVEIWYQLNWYLDELLGY